MKSKDYRYVIWFVVGIGTILFMMPPWYIGIPIIILVNLIYHNLMKLYTKRVIEEYEAKKKKEGIDANKEG